MVDCVAMLYVGIEAEDHEGSVILQSCSCAMEERRAPTLSRFSVLISVLILVPRFNRETIRLHNSKTFSFSNTKMPFARLTLLTAST
jgi:hypothetical protein